MKDQERWGAGWGLQAMAAADRAELALGAYMDTIYQLVQPHALAFQKCAAVGQTRADVVMCRCTGHPAWCWHGQRALPSWRL